MAETDHTKQGADRVCRFVSSLTRGLRLDCGWPDVTEHGRVGQTVALIDRRGDGVQDVESQMAKRGKLGGKGEWKRKNKPNDH